MPSSTFLINVQGQPAPIIPFVANATNQPPTINGQWEPGEWDNAVAYNVTLGYHATPYPTIRLQHDNATLYGLVDVPTDTGGTYVDNGQKSWGWVTLTFYYGHVFSVALTNNPFLWLFLDTNQTGLGSTNWFISAGTNTSLAKRFILAWKHSAASTSITTTSLSMVKHRIWEFSIQLYPYLVLEPLNQNGTSIGFNVLVADSGGNQMKLVANDQPGRLVCVESTTPAPEFVNPLMIHPILFLAPMLGLRLKRRIERHRLTKLFPLPKVS